MNYVKLPFRHISMKCRVKDFVGIKFHFEGFPYGRRLNEDPAQRSMCSDYAKGWMTNEP